MGLSHSLEINRVCTRLVDKWQVTHHRSVQVVSRCLVLVQDKYKYSNVLDKVIKRILDAKAKLIEGD